MKNYGDIFNLKGKNIVVNGGLALIDLEITKTLLEFDASLLVIDKNEEKINFFRKKYNKIKFICKNTSQEKKFCNNMFN